MLQEDIKAAWRAQMMVKAAYNTALARSWRGCTARHVNAWKLWEETAFLGECQSRLLLTTDSSYSGIVELPESYTCMQPIELFLGSYCPV